MARRDDAFSPEETEELLRERCGDAIVGSRTEYGTFTIEVANESFADVARTGIMYEGYGVDHVHAKLFPMHGTAGNTGEDWRAVASTATGYFDRYQGYLSSHDHERADDGWLTEVADWAAAGSAKAAAMAATSAILTFSMALHRASSAQTDDFEKHSIQGKRVAPFTATGSRRRPAMPPDCRRMAATI
jgi:hypothetical protein